VPGNVTGMRGTVDDLESPHPIGHELPALFQDDDVAQAFTSGLDVVLAPIYLTLDAIESYVDPWLAPMDFLTWIGEWVSAEYDEALPEQRQRALVARSAELLGWAGTRRGLEELVELLAGVRPEIEDSGGAAWSASPGEGDLPGSATPSVTVRVRVDDLPAAGLAREDRLERVRQVVQRHLPAHVPATVEVAG
jgi:phage tail-like protein